MDENYAIIDSTNIVINVCLWDGVTPWQPPEGCIAVQSDTAQIGWIYDPSTGTFTPPEVV